MSSVQPATTPGFITKNPWLDEAAPSAWMLTVSRAPTASPKRPRTSMHGPTPVSVVRVMNTVAPNASRLAFDPQRDVEVERVLGVAGRCRRPDLVARLPCRPDPDRRRDLGGVRGVAAVVARVEGDDDPGERPRRQADDGRRRAGRGGGSRGRGHQQQREQGDKAASRRRPHGAIVAPRATSSRTRAPGTRSVAIDPHAPPARTLDQEAVAARRQLEGGQAAERAAIVEDLVGQLRDLEPGRRLDALGRAKVLGIEQEANRQPSAGGAPSRAVQEIACVPASRSNDSEGPRSCLRRGTAPAHRLPTTATAARTDRARRAAIGVRSNPRRLRRPDRLLRRRIRAHRAGPNIAVITGTGPDRPNRAHQSARDRAPDLSSGKYVRGRLRRAPSILAGGRNPVGVCRSSIHSGG